MTYENLYIRLPKKKIRACDRDYKLELLLPSRLLFIIIRV